MDTEQRKPVPRYEDDLQEWLLAQAAAIRERRWDDVDVDNLTEEIDGVAGSDRREVISRLTVLVMHLLKQQAQPERKSRSWENTIRTQAQRLNLIFEDSPSLRARLSMFVAKGYPNACKNAAGETGLPLDVFPSTMTEELWERLHRALQSA